MLFCNAAFSSMMSTTQQDVGLICLTYPFCCLSLVSCLPSSSWMNYSLWGSGRYLNRTKQTLIIHFFKSIYLSFYLYIEIHHPTVFVTPLSVLCCAVLCCAVARINSVKPRCVLLEGGPFTARAFLAEGLVARHVNVWHFTPFT